MDNAARMPVAQYSSKAEMTASLHLDQEVCGDSQMPPVVHSCCQDGALSRRLSREALAQAKLSATPPVVITLCRLNTTAAACEELWSGRGPYLCGRSPHQGTGCRWLVGQQVLMAVLAVAHGRLEHSAPAPCSCLLGTSAWPQQQPLHLNAWACHKWLVRQACQLTRQAAACGWIAMQSPAGMHGQIHADQQPLGG